MQLKEVKLFLSLILLLYNVGEYVGLYSVEDGIILPRVQIIGKGAGNIQYTVGDSYTRTNGRLYCIIHETLLSPQFETLPCQDIIGDPARIAATFPDGVLGQWIPVIPDGGSTDFSLSKKAIESSATSQFTGDDGATWTSTSVTIDNVNNTYTSNTPATRVQLLQYSTKANPYELANNTEVRGRVGDVVATSDHDSGYGSLTTNLISKVATGTGTPRVLTGFKLQEYLIANDLLSTHWHNLPTHDTINLVNNGSAAVKAFPYVTSENGQYYLQWVYKEMIWDNVLDTGSEFIDKTGIDTTLTVVGNYYHVTSGALQGFWYCLIGSPVEFDSIHWAEVDGKLLWDGQGTSFYKRWDGNGFGDDNKFTIINGESTEPDDNGNSVIIGQKRVALPYFTGKA